MLRALLLATALLAQSTASDVAGLVWEAVQPALPFPAATEQLEPVDGSTSARWIVRRAGKDEGALVAEVVANPLNPEAQARAVQDMAAIQQEVFAAERRAQVELEHARESARVSGAPVSVQGVTLDDEGLAGDRANAEERMTIDVELGRAEHAVRIDAVDAPSSTAHAQGAAWLVKVPARELQRDGDPRAQYLPAEAIVYLGSAKPAIDETAPQVFTVRAGGENVVAVTLRGNSDLIDQVLARTDWSRVIRR